MNRHRFLVAATHKSSGKTTFTLGLLRGLRERGQSAQPFKKGPDYIDPMWHALAAGAPSYNLDFNTQDPAEIRALFTARAAPAEVAVVEGNIGLFDGMALDGSNSNAGLAALLDLPVVLVVDCEGMSRGIAPLLLGYAEFTPRVAIAGVVLNRVAGRRHEARLREAVTHYTPFPVLGAVHRHPDLNIEERHLGLVPSNEAHGAEEVVARIARRLLDQVDLDALLAAVTGSPLAAGPADAPAAGAGAGRLRIGIARDAAFGFYYADDLEDLAAAGAELVPFSPIHDNRLPADLDGLFLGGGFPETHLAALAGNGPLRGAVRAAIEGGLPAYAECGGLMYLSRGLQWGEQFGEMAGVLPFRVRMHARPQGRGYARVRETDRHPWPGGQPGRELAAHEFHYSAPVNPPGDLDYAYQITRGTGVDGHGDGIVHRNLLASYVHLRNQGGHRWTDRFIAFVRRCRGR
jgi:cobyrinic acid a,c-diamide synthase